MRSFFGSVTRRVAGVDYRLVLDFNAIVHFEDALGLKFFEVAATWEGDDVDPEVRHLIALCHAALQDHHPELTVKQAGQILSKDVGLIEALLDAANRGAVDGLAPDRTDEKKPETAAK